MRSRIIINIAALLLTGVIFTACNNARRLPEGRYLLKKNQIESQVPGVSSSEVRNYIKQKPNSKLLGVWRFKLSMYMLGDRLEKESGLKNWLMEKVGQEPVVLDTTLANSSVRQLEYYLGNKGYFNADVTKEVDTNKQKATVTYHFRAGNPYRIDTVIYVVEDSSLREEVLATRENSLLGKGTVFDAEKFDDERERITDILRNKGYYYFNKNFIRVKVDSALQGRKINAYLQVNNRVFKAQMYNDSLVSLPHYKYRVRKVFIYPDYDAMADESIDYDTLVFQDNKNEYYYLYQDNMPYKPEVLNRFIFIEPGEYYKMQDASMTNTRLANLRQFKYVNISFRNNYADIKPWFHDTLPKNLDCHIRLTRFDRQYYVFEWLGKNTSRDLGTEVSFIYGNKNLFRGAEIFNVNTNVAMETQRVIGDTDDQTISEFLPFNTFEAGINTSLEIPKFLLPVAQSRFPAYFKPHTTLFAGYNYRERPDYTRHLTNFSFGYLWNESPTKQHQLYPLYINSIKLHPDSSFIAKLNEINNKKFLIAYQDHLIIGLKYTFLYNSQAFRRKAKDFWYFRGNIESSGLLISGINYLTDAPRNAEDSYELLNIQYAQYIRLDADVRYYYRITFDNVIATRFAIGVGIPYWNMKALPFEKSFFVGGSNGIRAWPVRSIGPGGFSGTVSNFDKIGDISLETSVEYRFPVYDFVKGAVFLDAGNVWLKNQTKDFPQGNFEFDTFYKQLAVGTGLGLRLDFSFFVIRVDAGIKMIDPSEPAGSRWVLNQYRLKYTNFNFGIGYPF